MLFFAIGCVSVNTINSEVVSSYSARASWQWQSTDHFFMRGRARLEGKNQLFSGPFLLWASRELGTVRADFSGPDGSVLLSFLLDSTGCLVYQPREVQAYYFPGGIPFNKGLLDVNSVISLIRTGFPVIPEQWKIVASADTSLSEEIRWSFTSDESDSAYVILQNTDLFPTFVTDSFSLSVNSTSWHDSFNAWPMEWSLNSPSINAILRHRSIDTEREPDDSIWLLQIPIAIDTIPSSFNFWDSTFHFPVR